MNSASMFRPTAAASSQASFAQQTTEPKPRATNSRMSSCEMLVALREQRGAFIASFLAQPVERERRILAAAPAENDLFPGGHAAAGALSARIGQRFCASANPANNTAV